MVEQWLRALQLGQIASGRLLHELHVLESNLAFWNKRLEKGGHFWFALLRRGPLEFCSRVGDLVKHVIGRGERRNEQENAMEGCTDASMVEARVLLFRVLREEVCEAIAGVHVATSLLYLGKEEGLVDEASQEETPGLCRPVDEETLFQRTDAAVAGSMVAVMDAFERMREKVDEILETQGLMVGPMNEEQRAAFSNTLFKALGIDRLRRVWTQQDVTTPLQRSISKRIYSTKVDDDVEKTIWRVEKVLGLRGMRNTGGKTDTSVHDALQEARDLCAMLQSTAPLICLPKWMLMPNALQQHWIRYTFMGIAAVYAGVFVVKHSPLCGSKDLEKWSVSAFKGIQSAWSTHVIQPLENLQGELFNTFRRRPAIVSLDEYEADRDSLKRMLEDFKRDVHKKGKASPAMAVSEDNGGIVAHGDIGDDRIVLEGMELMMHCYESELKKPIRNLVTGDLMRSLLIQVQKMKVDTESAMLEIDQILKANELSISLVAAIPAFILAGSILFGFGRMLTPSPPDPRKEAMNARLAMIDVERALEDMVPAGASAEELSAQTPTEGLGEFWYRLAVAYDETEALYTRHKGLLGSTSANAEWTQLRADMMSLASPGPTELKLRSAARMLRVYSIYQR